MKVRLLAVAALAVALLGASSYPYYRLVDGVGASTASVSTFGGLDGANGNSTASLVTSAWAAGYNALTDRWDRLRVDPNATGVLRTTTGGATTATIAAASAGPNVVKNSAGRLARVLITTAGTASETFYDNASACSGTVVGVVPASTSVGQVYDFSMPAANGVTGCGGAGSPAVTVSYY